MTQEIIGSEPSISEIKIRFEKEFQTLIKNLESISKQNLENQRKYRHQIQFKVVL